MINPLLANPRLPCEIRLGETKSQFHKNEEKERNKKLKEVKARLNFKERSGTSRYSESRTIYTKEHERRYRSRRSRSPRPSVFSRIRRDRSRSPRQNSREKEGGVFKRLGNRGRSVSARSYDHSHRSYSRYTEALSESEDSGGGHWKSRSKNKKSSREDDDLSQPWVCKEINPFTLRIHYFDFSKTRMPSHIKTYDESEDPEYHLKIFQAAAKTERWAMPTWCHMFNSTSTGTAMEDSEIIRGRKGSKIDSRSSQKLPKEIFALEKGKFKALPPMTTSVEKRNHIKFCEFHGEVWHNMDECMHLKKQIEEMLKAEKLSHLIKELKQNSGKEQPKAKKKGETSGKNKVLAILIVQPWKRVAWKKITKIFSPNTKILFPPLDEEEGTKASEILYEHYFNRLRLEIKNQLMPTTTPLIGFNGENYRKTRSQETASTSINSSRNAEAPDRRRSNYPKKQQPADMTDVPRHIAEHRLNVRKGCSPHDDSWRMCVDFKDLNKACPKDGYPLPEIDWKVESLCRFPFKCFLDAYKGYHQIQMAKEDEEKTAFITSQGIFYYTKPADMTGVPRHIAEHRLNVRKGCSPVRQKKRGQAADKKLGNKVGKLVEAGIMKEVHYHDWLSNPVMVKSVMTAGEYAYKGYHQIQMAKEDEEKTAFITSQGIFYYTKVPFSLRNVGATYQRLVDKAFHKQIRRNLEVYVDDLVIKSRTKDETVRDIEETFKTLREINMKLNSKNCTFGVEEGMFLGYKVNTKGLKTSNTFHNAIMEAGGKDRPPMLAPDKDVLVTEGSSETTTERYMENYKNVLQDIRDQLNAEAEAVQIILIGINNDIYFTVDACPNTCEMWKAIERLKQGESFNVQDLETNLY
nr:reverse transcriptase domain-containing protein [Tanacetum cinerariifolium]